MRENQIRRKYEFEEESRFRKEASALKKVVDLTELLERLASKPGGKETV
jgi:hypothetical protein